MAIKKAMFCSFLAMLLVSSTACAASLSDFVNAVKSATKSATVPSDISSTPVAPRFTNIFEAAQQGTAEDIIQIIQVGGNVNARDASGNTPLMYAAAQNLSAAVIEVLVSAGADVNAQNTDQGITALMWAASAGRDNSEVVRTLIRLGADINVRNTQGATAMDFARDRNIPVVISALTPIQGGGLGSPTLHTGNIRGMGSPTLNQTPVPAPTPVPVPDSRLLFEAAQKGTAEDVIQLIQAGVNVNVRDNDRTLLMNSPNIRKYSARRNVAIGKNDLTKNTSPLLYAAVDNPSGRVIDVLIQAGANITLKSEGGGTVLMQAAMFNPSTEVIEALIRGGLSVKARDNSGNTPLIYAVLGDSPAAVEVLLRYGAEPDAETNEGATPLVTAIANNISLEVIEELVRGGANVNRPVMGIMPMTWAATRWDVQQFLQRNGARQR